MARTALTVQTIDVDGVAAAYTAAQADGNSFVNDGQTFLHVKNAGAEITATVQTPAKVQGIDVEEVEVTIPATTGDVMIGPFPRAIFDQGAAGVYVDYSSVTTVTVAAFKLG